MSQELYTNYIKILSSVEIQNDLYVGQNMGIGTLMPTEVLDVSGNTKISGNLYVDSNAHILSSLYVSNDVTISGKLSALGNSYFTNTVFSTTSAICAYNTGVGPALYIYQAAGPYDVASFYDGDGIEVLHVGNAFAGSTGKVGVNTGDPNKELTVNGSFSASGNAFINGEVIIGDGTGTEVLFVDGIGKVGINTGDPNKELTVVGDISATGFYYGDGSNLTGIVAGDIEATTLVRSNSANWESTYNTFKTTSATYVTTVATTTPGLSAITKIVAVSAVPVTQTPGTLYILI